MDITAEMESPLLNLEAGFISQTQLKTNTSETKNMPALIQIACDRMLEPKIAENEYHGVQRAKLKFSLQAQLPSRRESKAESLITMVLLYSSSLASNICRLAMQPRAERSLTILTFQLHDPTNF